MTEVCREFGIPQDRLQDLPQIEGLIVSRKRDKPHLSAAAQDAPFEFSPGV